MFGGKCISRGLTTIKGVGEKAAEAIAKMDHTLTNLILKIKMKKDLQC